VKSFGFTIFIVGTIFLEPCRSCLVYFANCLFYCVLVVYEIKCKTSMLLFYISTHKHICRQIICIYLFLYL
jgi:hypothetical protein